MNLRLAPLFLGILAALPACPFFYDCSDLHSETRTVDPAALASAQADGELSLMECDMLCAPATGETSGGAVTIGDMSTGSPTTGDASTGGTGTGSTGGTGTGSTGGTGTGTSTTTGGSIFVPSPVSCSAVEGDPGAVLCSYDPGCVGGRRPAGLRSRVPCTPEELGTWFASTAHLEAASVPAFERLAAELRGHGAPVELLEAAAQAAQDEVRHAAMMQAQAQRRGVALVAVDVAPPQPRSLLELAIENAVEGCVRETWAALLAAHQAAAAEDPEVRALMTEIAVDETRHAELAWAIDSWLRTRLSAEELVALDAARQRAISGVLSPSDLPEAWIRGLGLPDRAREAATLL